MTLAPRLSVTTSPTVTWSLVAGLYTFVCGTATAFALSDLLMLLASVIGLPTPWALVAFACPTLVVGPVVWWTLVERRGSHTYLLGGTFGLLTALLTGLLWTGRFVQVWGVELAVVPAVSLLVGIVLGVAALAGVLTGLPMMYARRRLADGVERPT